MADWPTSYRRSASMFMDTGIGSGGSQTRTDPRPSANPQTAPKRVERTKPSLPRYARPSKTGGPRRAHERPKSNPRIGTPNWNNSLGNRSPEFSFQRPGVPISISRTPHTAAYALSLRGIRMMAWRFTPWGDLLQIGLILLKRYQEAQDQTVLFHPSSAYSLVCDLGGSATELSSLYGGNVCNTGQYYSPGFVPTAESEWVSEWQVVDPNTASNICERVWHRTLPAEEAPEFVPAQPEVLPQFMPWPDEFPDVQAVPAVMPQLDPATKPIGKPAPQPETLPWAVLPYRQPNPWRDPVEQTERGPKPEPALGPPVGEQPPPIVRPPLNPEFPGGKVVVRPPSFVIPNRPPRKGEKEKKLAISLPAGHPVMQGIGAVTEGMDVIDAIYWAIPKKYRPKGFTNPWDKARAIYDNADNIDWEKALENILKNEIEDQIIGRSSKARNKAQRDAGWKGRPVGAGSGVGGTSGIAF